MIRPTRGYCLIEPKEAEEVSAGGVILPDRVKDMPQKGKVLAVGGPINRYDGGVFHQKDKKIRVPDQYCDAKVGDTVIFKRFVDNRIKEEGKELLLVKFEDILGIYE